MIDLKQVLKSLIAPLVDQKERLRIEQQGDEMDKEIILKVFADRNDISRLIGHKGIMASSLRQVMSVSAHHDHRHIVIKFEQE